MSKKTTALVSQPSEQALAELKSQFPQEQGFVRSLLPRLGMISQDKTEGKGKAMKVVSEAGTFFIEKQTDEKDENDKNIWEREELGNSIEATIIYQRKQLRYYNEATEQYTSSPVYDEDTDIVPLFCDKKEVARGTPADLKAMATFAFEKDGKVKSKLEDNRILYVLYEGEVYQMNLRGSSMYSYMSYGRTVSPSMPAVLTAMNSESKEKGSIAWNQMTFTKVRDLNGEEVDIVLEKVREIREAIVAEKQYYAKPAEKKDDLEDFG